MYAVILFGCQKEFSIDSPTSSLPVITTVAATNVTDSSAVSGGNITSEGSSAVTIRGVCWSTSHQPDTSGSHTRDGGGAGTFVSNLTGLTDTTYFVRAYAVNSTGIVYGNEISFRYNSAITLATVTTTAITAITGISAEGGGNITADGGSTVTSRGICWSTTAAPVVTGNHTTDGSGTGVFSSTLTGLAQGTQYFVRAYATNAAGTAYGNEVIFTTTGGVLQDIYVAGYESNGTSRVAKIWKNGVATALTDGSKDGMARDIFVSGSDVYAAGIETGSTRIAETWKNGVATVLQSGPLYIAEARSLFVSGSDVYVAGFNNTVSGSAVYWKNGVASGLAGGSPFGINDALDVFVSGTDVYTCGWGRNSGNMVALVWKNGQSTSLSDGSTDAFAFSVHVSATDVYVGGWKDDAVTAASRPTLWKNGIATTLPTTSNTGIVRSVFVSGNDVYAAGSDGSAAKIWKNGVGTALTNGSTFAGANAVFVSGNDVYVAGFESNGTHTVAKLWKNGTAIPLTDGSNDAGADGVFVQ